MKCLIAGLPSAGKTTYIGALSYLLSNPVRNQVLSFAEVPDDMTYLDGLQQPWLSVQPVERTVRGYSNNINLKLKRNADGSTIDVSFPDIAGEDFQSIVQKQSEVIKQWSREPDVLMLFVRDLCNLPFADQFGDDALDKNRELPAFELKDISNDVQNVLLLRELHNLFPWKKLVICFTAWDKYQEQYDTPKKYLRENSRFMNNFIERYFPDARLFGISAQGAEYSEDNQELLLNKTESGQRTLVVSDDGTTSYDLTLPLNALI